ncbi:MAG TPA: YihY/virulence factor BrkB family protein [Candidatus Saccharimonadales bacterium]
MKILNTVINKLDAWQQRHHWSAMIYAVIRKYGEDESGSQAALLTYYSFLSLFPLLLVLTTVTSLVANNHPGLQHDVIRSTTTYFPVLGNQLAQHISTLHKNGLALVIGIVFTLYGARGVADACRRGVLNIWRVPKSQRAGFPKTVPNSLAIVIVGGIGFMVASISTGFAAAAGHGPAFRLLSVAVNLFVLFWLFTFLLNACLPRHVPVKDTRSGALAAAIGLVILQALGGYLLKTELKRLDALYSYFAIALGLLFWIYLQAQLLYYAVTLAAVRAQHLWPRSLNDKSGKTPNG